MSTLPGTILLDTPPKRRRIRDPDSDNDYGDFVHTPVAPAAPLVVHISDATREAVETVAGVTGITDRAALARYIENRPSWSIDMLVDELLDDPAALDKVPCDQAPPSSSVPAVLDVPALSDEEAALQTVLQMFPDIDVSFAGNHVRNVLSEIGSSVVEHLSVVVAANAVERIMSGPSYPKAPKQTPKRITKSASILAAEHIKTSSFDPPVADPEHLSSDWCHKAISMLLEAFPYVPKDAVQQASARHRHQYALAWHDLSEKVTSGGGRIRLNATRRKSAPLDVTSLPPGLQEQRRYVLAYVELQREEQRKRARYQEMEAAGEFIECECCFGSAPIDEMVQCGEGHLFCSPCLVRQAEMAAYDAAKTDLRCMSMGGECSAPFPWSQVERAIPEKLREKLSERQSSDVLRQANVEGLVQCPFCNFGAIVENEHDREFRCYNEACGKVSCRLCKEESHIPLRCNEVEKNAETKERLAIEERMTIARVRHCHSCKAPFYKTEGCNLMTCRCGGKSCYICRAAVTTKEGYDHFCRHVHQPGKGCPEKCGKCFLFTDSVEDDKRLVEEERAKLAKELLAKASRGETALDEAAAKAILGRTSAAAV